MSNALLDKAIWLADEGRVHIIINDEFYTEALVDGIGGTYQVTDDPEGWHCSCPAGQHHSRCSHVEAVAIVRESHGPQ